MAFGQRGRAPSLDSLDRQISQLERKIRKGEEARKELPKVQAKRAELLKKLNDPEFREQVQDSAAKALERAMATLEATGMSRDEILEALGQTEQTEQA